MKRPLGIAVALGTLALCAALVGGLVVITVATQTSSNQALAAAGLDEVPASDCLVPNQVGGAPTAPGIDKVQEKNAAAIAAAARAVVPTGQVHQALVVAYAAALVESTMRNLPSRANQESFNYDYDTYPGGRVPAGDLDSVGLFQQRDLWGPMSERMNRVESAKMFLTGGRAGQRGLLDLNGWQVMEPGYAAQRVQVSAFPLRYTREVPRSRAIATAMLGGTIKAAPTCEPPTPGEPGGKGLGKCPPSGSPAERGLLPDALYVLRCGIEHQPRNYGLSGVGARPNRSDHGRGAAVDFMQSPGGRMPDAAQKARGDELAAWFQTNAKPLGITYIIWHKKIWSVSRADEGWRPYSHPTGGGGVTLDHYDHVHVSTVGSAGTYRGTGS